MRSCSVVVYRPVNRPTQRSFATIAILLSPVSLSHHSRATDTALEAIHITAERVAADTVVGPLGNLPVRDIPYSIHSITGELIANQQATGLADIIKYIPSTQIEDRGTAELGRPQARGFESNVGQTIISMM